jgi:hypothetical protein
MIALFLYITGRRRGRRDREQAATRVVSRFTFMSQNLPLAAWKPSLRELSSTSGTRRTTYISVQEITFGSPGNVTEMGTE